MLTEDQAKEKWCPFTSTRLFSDRSDGTITSDRRTNCVASACMAWRQHSGWSESDTVTAHNLLGLSPFAELSSEQLKNANDVATERGLERRLDMISPLSFPVYSRVIFTGYCGLAEKP